MRDGEYGINDYKLQHFEMYVQTSLVQIKNIRKLNKTFIVIRYFSHRFNL